MVNVLKSYYIIAGLILIINNREIFSQNYYFNKTYDINEIGNQIGRAHV